MRNRKNFHRSCLALLALGLFLKPDSGRAEWVMQDSHVRASFRAVQAIDGKIVWVGGTGGTCLRTLDGGTNWETLPVPGAEKLDFRGLAAFDAQTAVLMSSGDGAQGQARIYRTTDGGKTWTLAHEAREKGAFFDNITFWDKSNGLVCGDPIDDKLYLLRTTDGGKTWQRVLSERLPKPLTGEGAFAAGNSSMRMRGASQVWIASGAGERSRVFMSGDRGENWEVAETPMAGGESAGVFGIWFWDDQHGIGVGGDYKKEKAVSDNIVLTSDGGRTWQKGAPTDPPGHKESAVMLPGNKLIVIGPSGTALSDDFGRTWKKSDLLPLHGISAFGGDCWAVGNRGTIAKWK